MKAREITGILDAPRCAVAVPDDEILSLLTDSRSFTKAEGTVFFAIRTKHGDGCRYLNDLYVKGVRNYVVPLDREVPFKDANVWYVDDVVLALQAIAASHRGQFDIPVIGITGSNGKTVVKDWLVQMLSPDRRICSNPKSYNSQIGVPLSVWQLSGNDSLAIFEAGISMPREMERLQHVIQPTIGIFTNIGSAHDEGFSSLEQKVTEKLRLFSACDTLIFCADHESILSAATKEGLHRFTWGHSEGCDIRIISAEIIGSTTKILFRTTQSDNDFSVVVPFFDQASVENAMHCIAMMVYLGYDIRTINNRVRELAPIEMRMEMIEATSNCLLINDSYSLDMGSLIIALNTLEHDHSHLRHTVILSDMVQTGVPEEILYCQVAECLRQHGVSRIIAVGEAICRNKDAFAGIECSCYQTTDDFITRFKRSDFSSETILLKGARAFGFERIAKLLQRRTHETTLEVNINAMENNLRYYRSRLNPGTRLMAMVKAASYGAGKVEVASALQWNGVDYLTVAYADEGVELRRGGITLPIMVMNPEEAAFDDIIRYQLEPDIYSFRILEAFAKRVAAQQKQVAIHIEFDTGMHRLGFTDVDIESLSSRLNKVGDTLVVRSLFSHLACSEDPAMDDFTRNQIGRFGKWCDLLKAKLVNGSDILCHILNSSGITRFPEAQMDMVRLGIGLYGISPEPDVQAHLQEVSRLVTRISQIKSIPEGDSVGYNRAWVAKRPTRLAILSIGYADGLNRHLGGTGHVMIDGRLAPIVGKVCMDMCFVDVTDIPCSEGDRVVFFGEGNLLESNAAAAGTISYELLTAVSPRVKRVYVQEG